jgi:hypothetical protein
MATLVRETLLEPSFGAASPAVRRLRSSLPEAFRSRLKSARELEQAIRDAAGEGALPTAVPALDRLLGGGIPRGQLVELVGTRTSGRFSALLAVLAAATGVGEAAALVDLGDGLDPGAALSLGADLDRLLWLRPTMLKKALAATEMLLDGGFPLVALDLGNPPVRGGRGAEAAWLRLARAAQAHDAALLVSTPYRVSGTAAGVVLKAERGRAAWRGDGGAIPLLDGIALRVVLEKQRGRLPGSSEGLTLTAAGSPKPATAAISPREAPRLREKKAAEPLPFIRRAAVG